MGPKHKNPDSPDKNIGILSAENLPPKAEKLEIFRALFNRLILQTASEENQTGSTKGFTLENIPKESIDESYIKERLTSEDIEALLHASDEVFQDISTSRLTDFGFHTVNDPAGKLRFFHLRKIEEGGMKLITKCFAYPVGKPKESFTATSSITKTYCRASTGIFQNPHIRQLTEEEINVRIAEARIQIAFGRALLRYQAIHGLQTEDMLNKGLLPPIALDSTPGLEIMINPLITPKEGTKSVDFFAVQKALPTKELLCCLKKYAETLHFLNSNGLSHPDLKEENLFYGYVNGKLYPLIGDLALVELFNSDTQIHENCCVRSEYETIDYYSYHVNMLGIARTPALAKRENKALKDILIFRKTERKPPPQIMGHITAQANLASFREIIKDTIGDHMTEKGANMQSTPEGKKAFKIITRGINAISKIISASNLHLESLADIASGASIAEVPYYYNQKDFSQLTTFEDVAKLLGDIIEQVKAIQPPKWHSCSPIFNQ